MLEIQLKDNKDKRNIVQVKIYFILLITEIFDWCLKNSNNSNKGDY